MCLLLVSPYISSGLGQVLHQVGARGLWGLVVDKAESREQGSGRPGLLLTGCVTLKRPVTSLALHFLLCQVW